METRPSASNPLTISGTFFPDADGLAALRAWYSGLSAAAAVSRYLPGRVRSGRSAHGVLGEIRRELVAIARRAHREDLAAVLSCPSAKRARHTHAAAYAIELLRHLKPPIPSISDDVKWWFEVKVARALHAKGIVTIADLMVRFTRRRGWWRAVPGLGSVSARKIEAFFTSHPDLAERAQAVASSANRRHIVPWENLRLPHEVDGSEGTFRAPVATCTLNANNDYAAVNVWLFLHESAATQRSYRKEAERLILWAIVERGRALSSLTTDDAIAYRAFLRRPAPRDRWVGPPSTRNSPEWRPFKGNLASRSVAYALSILNALFAWLIEQRYVLANPFSGLKVIGDGKSADMDTSRAFSEGEWNLVRATAEGLEWSYGWSEPAAQRLRFLLDFGFATGLRSSELVGATLGNVSTDARDEHWLRVTGKGHKTGRVALPPLAWDALIRYLALRKLPVNPERWAPKTPLVGNLEVEGTSSIHSSRLWEILKRFFRLVADQIAVDHPALAEKLRHASPHWMRHTHATHALEHGAELTTVRDNLRHASISTTSLYLHGDDVKRATQLRSAFERTKTRT
jgi:site-specific recombinase XerD